MKRLIFISLLFLLVFSLQAQSPYMRWQRIGQINFNGTGTDSILIKGYTSSEIANNEVRWRGDWSVNIYPQLISGTLGTAEVHYRLSDWLENVAAGDSNQVIATWTVTNRFLFVNIEQTPPVYGLWLYIKRLTGTGNIKFHVYDTKIKYK